MIEYVLTSLVNGTPRGHFQINTNSKYTDEEGNVRENDNGQLCPPSSMSAVKGHINLNANWSLPATNIDRSNLTFR